MAYQDDLTLLLGVSGTVSVLSGLKRQCGHKWPTRLQCENAPSNLKIPGTDQPVKDAVQANEFFKTYGITRHVKGGL